MAVISGSAGYVTYGSALNITGITKASNAVISVAATAGFTAGDRVIIRGVVGMTEINGLHGTVQSVVANTSITVNIDSQTFTTYVSGGTITHTIDITGFSYTATAQVADVTDSSSSTWKDFTPSGYQDFSGTFEGFVKSGINPPDFGSSISFGLYETDTASATGSGILTSKAVTLSIDGTSAVKVSYSFKGTGTITEANT